MYSRCLGRKKKRKKEEIFSRVNECLHLLCFAKTVSPASDYRLQLTTCIVYHRLARSTGHCRIHCWLTEVGYYTVTVQSTGKVTVG